MSLAETEGVFEGFGEAGFVARGDLDAVLDDVDFSGKFFECGDGVGAEHFLVEEDAEVALGIEEGKELFGRGVFGDWNGEDDEDGFVAQVGLAPLKDGGRRVGLDGLAGAGVVARGEAGVEELEVVVDLGEGADGRASGADGVFLLDGDGGRDAVDAIDLGLVHAVKELTDVGREGFDVAALALGVECVKGEGGFSAAGRAGDDGELADGDVEIEVLQVVLPGSSDADSAVCLGGVRFLGHGAKVVGEVGGASDLFIRKVSPAWQRVGKVGAP